MENANTFLYTFSLSICLSLRPAISVLRGGSSRKISQYFNIHEAKYNDQLKACLFIFDISAKLAHENIHGIYFIDLTQIG